MGILNFFKRQAEKSFDSSDTPFDAAQWKGNAAHAFVGEDPKAVLPEAIEIDAWFEARASAEPSDFLERFGPTDAARLQAIQDLGVFMADRLAFAVRSVIEHGEKLPLLASAPDSLKNGHHLHALGLEHDALVLAMPTVLDCDEAGLLGSLPEREGDTQAFFCAFHASLANQWAKNGARLSDARLLFTLPAGQRDFSAMASALQAQPAALGQSGVDALRAHASLSPVAKREFARAIVEFWGAANPDHPKSEQVAEATVQCASAFDQDPKAVAKRVELDPKSLIALSGVHAIDIPRLSPLDEQKTRMADSLAQRRREGTLIEAPQSRPVRPPSF